MQLKELIVEFLQTQPERKSKILYITQHVGERVQTTLDPLWIKVFAAMRELVRAGVIKIIYKLQSDKRTFKHDE